MKSRPLAARESGHLRGDGHDDGAVVELPDAPVVVENGVGQGRVWCSSLVYIYTHTHIYIYPYISRHLPSVVENEVGQGRVQELPLLGIHGKVGNVDAPRVALRVVYTRLYTPMYAPYIRVCIRLYTPIYAPIYAERAMSTPRELPCVS